MFRHDLNDFNYVEIHRKEILSSSNSLMKEISFSKDDEVFFEGESSYYVFEVLEGVCYTSNTLTNGERLILSFFYTDDIVGLSCGQNYHCDCIAVTPLTLRAYQVSELDNVLRHDWKFSKDFLNKALAYNKSADRHMLVLRSKSGLARTALFLCQALERQGEKKGGVMHLCLPMRRVEIADFLGLTLETVSRHMSSLRKMGLVSFKNSRDITILDMAGLRKAANLAFE